MITVDWERWNKLGEFLPKNGGRALAVEDLLSEEEIQRLNDTLMTIEQSILGLEDIIVLAKARSKEQSR